MSGVCMIVDYSRVYTVVNGVQYFFSIFIYLRNYIFVSAKKCVDLNEAAKCVDIASLLITPSHNRTKHKMATIFGLTYKLIVELTKV